MRLFLQYAASGLATGCAFALVATGFVAIYRVTRVVNFAQGVFAVLAGMMAYTLLAIGVPHFVAEALAVVAAVVAGALVGFVAIGRRGTSPLASLIITLGLGIGSYAVLILIWGDQPISFDGLKGNLDVGGVGMQVQYLLVVVLTAGAFVALDQLSRVSAYYMEGSAVVPVLDDQVGTAGRLTPAWPPSPPGRGIRRERWGPSSRPRPRA